MRRVKVLENSHGRVFTYADYIKKPCSSIREFEELETRVKSDELEQRKLFKSFERIGGKDARQHVGNLLQYLGTPALFSFYTVCGTKDKRQFPPTIKGVIDKSVLKCYNVKSTECAELMRKKLKNCKQTNPDEEVAPDQDSLNESILQRWQQEEEGIDASLIIMD